ncbi:hypothetical protein J5J10_17250 [Ciceribacter sp. L1K23]|uniref:hypothetical protein n=1 Tax=Ciceribacter sp. L1K23 TaxID=2820276 RepID=UPI001B81F48D|nr:hypothetical protein [Ciceribacter sp. L1K23]MBR0557437.1 hypothetical protein [Ciceribacter sp. L1K23]
MARSPFTHLAVIAAMAFVGPVAAALAAPPVQGEIFEGLPGVKPLGPEEPKYRCHTVTRYSGKRNGIRFFDDNMPYLAYRCESKSNGAVYEGGRPPVSPHWFPGINPHHLPE